jgi:hypothetical protein
MLIANPTYDRAFKLLMADNQVVKFFISTLLQKEVLSVQLLPQEATPAGKYKKNTQAPKGNSKPEAIPIYRVDFAAVIKTPKGRDKILVEVQKSGTTSEIGRFRHYLAEHYMRKDTVDGKKNYSPITLIYILGDNLPHIESACVKIGREYTDMITDKRIEKRHPFIEKLSHDCYVVQTQRIENKQLKTTLDELLSIFEQTGFADNEQKTKFYNHEPNSKEVQQALSILHYVGTDAEERKALDYEAYKTRVLDDDFGEQNRTILKQNMEIAEKEAALTETKAALAAKEQEAAAEKAKNASLEARIAELERPNKKP